MWDGLSISKILLKDKGLARYLDGSKVAPSDEKSKAATATTTRKDSTSIGNDGTSIEEKSIASWKQNNANVVTWILNTINPSIAIPLRALQKAYDMWSHLKLLYH